VTRVVQSPTEGSCRDCPRRTADPTTLTQVSCFRRTT